MLVNQFTGEELESIVEREAEFLQAEADGIVYAGLTEAELHQAFNLVADPDDWRAPINALVGPGELEAAITAIEFFTATIPTVEVVSVPERVYRVRSVGYRNGPAGP